MRYENIKVFHGTPKEVEKKLNDYFQNAHPKAVVISTALALNSNLVVDEEAAAAETEAAAKEAARLAKAAAKNPPADGTTIPPEPAAPTAVELKSPPMKRVTHTAMTATVGIAYD